MLITAIHGVAKSIGCNRILQGVAVPHPTGDVERPTPEEELEARVKLLARALSALESEVDDQLVLTTA